jgi:multiple sugar transport system permease protein
VARPGHRRLSRRRGLVGFGFVAPYALFLVVFGLVPVGYGFFSAFVVENPLGGARIGVGNWSRVLTDYRLPAAAGHVGLFLAMWLPLMTVIVVTLALLVHARKGRFGSAVRFIYYLPGAIGGSAAALLWIFMVTPAVSPIGPVLRAFGFTTANDLLSGTNLPILLTVMAVAGGSGGWITILYGALQGLPGELLEAARIDGCSAWQLAWHIKLPLVRKYLAFMTITSLAAGTQMFIEPQLLGLASPGTISTTWSINQLAFTYAGVEANFGRASALSMMLLGLGLIAALIVIYRTDFYDTKGS